MSQQNRGVKGRGKGKSTRLKMYFVTSTHSVL